jgi:uncharacterized protein
MAKERPPLEEMTLRQLRKVASELQISKYSRMRKAQLQAAIQEKIANSENKTLNNSSLPIQEEQQVEAAKFEVGQQASVDDAFTDLDRDLGELPGGYGESRVVLMPRDPQWAYCYWDISNEHKEELRRQGGQQLALRIYDITNIDLNFQAPHNVQEYLCDEMAREWYVPIPVSDRDYLVDIGYRCADGRWLILARSASVRIPPVYPSDWIEDNFITVNWEQELTGQTVFTLIPPSKKQPMAAATQAKANVIYDQIFGMTKSVEAMRIAGSLFGSMQQTPEQAISSYIFPSGVGMWALPTASGINMSGVGMTMSGAGFASAPPARPRKFWLVADAELIVYGATEPDATVTVGGRPIKLNPDGTFRFQMSFQDGVIDYPIMAVAADGEQTRSVHMNFERKTPSRNTNTKEEAVEEWFA